MIPHGIGVHQSVGGCCCSTPEGGLGRILLSCLLGSPLSGDAEVVIYKITLTLLGLTNQSSVIDALNPRY